MTWERPVNTSQTGLCVREVGWRRIDLVQMRPDTELLRVSVGATAGQVRDSARIRSRREQDDATREWANRSPASALQFRLRHGSGLVNWSDGAQMRHGGYQRDGAPMGESMDTQNRLPRAGGAEPWPLSAGRRLPAHRQRSKDSRVTELRRTSPSATVFPRSAQ
jgi:hypothetical protein